MRLDFCIRMRFAENGPRKSIADLKSIQKIGQVPEVNPPSIHGGAVNIGGKEYFKGEVIQGAIGDDHQDTFSTKIEFLEGPAAKLLDFLFVKSPAIGITLADHLVQGFHESLPSLLFPGWSIWQQGFEFPDQLVLQGAGLGAGNETVESLQVKEVPAFFL